MNNDDFNNDVENENFEEMLENSLNRSDNFEVGDKVEGIIIQFDNDTAFVDITAKSEAMIDLSEFINDKGDIVIKKGEKISAYIVSTGKGQIQLSREIGSGFISIDLLKLACNNSIPVSGTPTRIIKGGYEVSISDFKCFCPLSQIGLKIPDNPENQLNKSYAFRISKIENNGRNIVVSRRALLEEERSILVNKLKSSLKIDDITKGVISAVQDFGIFVDIGGIEGLVPRSELSWSRFNSTASFKTGEDVTAKVISIDWDSNKITLSIKKLIPGPWNNINDYKIGESYNGKVTNIIQSGAFVELEPGLEGFVHISKMSIIKKINKPEEVVNPDDIINVIIRNIDSEKKQISLELKTNEPDPWQLPISGLTGKILIGIIESSKSSGVTVRLDNGMTGFIPGSELLLSRGSNIQKNYSTGKEMSVSIKEIEKENKKLILSEKGAIRKKDKADYREYMDQNTDRSTSTLGDQFKNQFDKIQKNIKI